MIYYLFFVNMDRGQDFSFGTAERIFKILPTYLNFWLKILYLWILLMVWLILKENIIISKLTFSKEGGFLLVYLVKYTIKFLRKNLKGKQSYDQINWVDYSKDEIALSVTNENLYKQLRCFKFYLYNNAVQCLMIFTVCIILY